MATSFTLNGKTINVTATGFKTGSKGKVVKPGEFLASLNADDKQATIDFCKANGLHTKHLPTAPSTPRPEVLIGGKTIGQLRDEVFQSTEFVDFAVVQDFTPQTQAA